MEHTGTTHGFLERQTPCPQCGNQDAWVVPGARGTTARVYCAQCRTTLAVLTRQLLKEMMMPVETKDPKVLAPPSSPIMIAAPTPPEPPDIPEPVVPFAVLAAATAPVVSTLPDGFQAHEALLQGFCQHLQQRMHAWMMDEHRHLQAGMDGMLTMVAKWGETVGQQNEHSTYQLAHALEKLQTDGLTIIHPPYQAMLSVQTPAGYALTLTVTKGTSSALVEELGRLEGWLQANGYVAQEVRV